jgi:hypothetical protein
MQTVDPKIELDLAVKPAAWGARNARNGQSNRREAG